MPTTLSSTLTARVNYTYTNVKTLGDVSQTATASYSQVMNNGTSNDQSDLAYSTQLTINAGLNTTLDLAGALTNEFGTTLTFVEITSVYIDLPSSVTNQASSVTIGDATAPVPLGFLGTTPRWQLPKGGVFFVANPTAGWAVTATSADGLKILNNDGVNAAVMNIVITGRSA